MRGKDLTFGGVYLTNTRLAGYMYAAFNASPPSYILE
ncbi:MAG: hypothetical protein JWQ57_688 [Mucilaginibacter sp.]|nr:hypothetical protein [Mucilaginibacter sp.]